MNEQIKQNWNQYIIISKIATNSNLVPMVWSGSWCGTPCWATIYEDKQQAINEVNINGLDARIVNVLSFNQQYNIK